jgi:AraC-like DNA-binding protein
MAANLDGDVSLTQLAAASRLSASYFTRAFKRRNSGQSLNEIALACGFADQSHFTTVFTRMVGASPGAWRRARQN